MPTTDDVTRTSRNARHNADRTPLRSAYLYLVCLVTLIMIVVGAVGVVRDAVQLAYPDPGYYGFEQAFGPDGKTELTAEEQQRRTEAAEASQRRQAVVGLVGSLALLLVAGPTYAYHWRRVQSEHRADVVAAGPLPD